jgi:hypothetical protein
VSARLGPRQQALLTKARAGTLIPATSAERVAARRLAARGLAHRYRFGNPATGYLTIYKIT